MYGSNCDTPCPTHCRHNTCFIHNGTCLSCKPGWRGAICTIRTFSFDILMINNLAFSLFTTSLKYTKIVHLDFLSTACSHGWYEKHCEQSCFGYCKRNTFCNHVTGQCEQGCDVGWSGSFCSKGYCSFFHIKWFV